MRSRYAAWAATMSPTRVAAELLAHARASSNATTASPTTAAAATAVVSERSTSAVAGSCVSSVAVRSGFIRVGSGFMAMRTTTGSPFVMPPSRPPARLVARR